MGINSSRCLWHVVWSKPHHFRKGRVGGHCKDHGWDKDSKGNEEWAQDGE